MLRRGSLRVLPYMWNGTCKEMVERHNRHTTTGSALQTHVRWQEGGAGVPRTSHWIMVPRSALLPQMQRIWVFCRPAPPGDGGRGEAGAAAGP